MPNFEGVTRQDDPFQIQETPGDLSTNLLELKNRSGTNVFSVTKDGVITGDNPRTIPVFNVKDPTYGAVGNGVADDTSAFQAAATAAIANNGILLIPQPPTSWRLTSTISLVPASGSQFHLDIVAEGPFNSIIWEGGDNTSIFKSYGWKRSVIEGVQVRFSTNKTGVVVWDVDHDSTRPSTSHLTWRNCRVTNSATPTDCVGWRIGHTSATEFSYLHWENCSVEWGTVAGTTLGWVMEENNGLVLSWDVCQATGCARAWTTTSTSGAGMANGGGSMFWYGCGGTSNDVDFDITSRTYLISGGRFETGKRFLQIPGSSNTGIATVQGVEIDAYAPSDGQIFRSDKRGTLILDGVEVKRNGAGSDYTSNMVRLSVSGSHPPVLIVRGCNFQADDPFYFTDGATPLIDVLDTTKCDGSGVRTGTFLNRSGLTAIPSVASAATIAAPVGAELINVTGTTTITSVTAGFAGQRLTIVFAGILTFTDGSNLKLAGNFVTTADDTITLICDGTNWVEVARSVN